MFTILIVKNLDATVTATDISKLFGFHTPFLRKNTCVEINDDGENRFAKVVCPSSACDEVMKLNGVEFYGKNIVIVPDQEGDEEITSANTTIANGENSTAEDDSTIVNDYSDIEYMLLDTRNYPDMNFNPVTEGEVCAALHISHPNDPHKAVRTFGGTRKGTFAIQSTDFSLYVSTHLVIRDREIPLTPFRKRVDPQSRPERRRFFDPEGLKIRIFDAWELRNRSIENEQFDEYFRNLGCDVIRHTQPERCKDDREIFNTNRFIVVKKTKEDGTKIDFGTRITVAGKSFRISYFGIQRYCGLCSRSHGWDCPTRTRNEFLRTLRKGKTDKTKIYADSTFRHINQLSLTADVACMTGGGISQICNAIPYDSHHDDVIIAGGTNELNVPDLKEFVYTVQKTSEKLVELQNDIPVTVVLPAIVTEVPDQRIKGEYLAETLSKVTNVIQLKDIEIETETGHCHPTVKGSFDMIKQIDTIQPLILPDCQDYTVDQAKYRGVQTIFKVGCRGCDLKEYTATLCNECQERSREIDVNEITERIRVLREEMFPTTNEVEMEEAREASKRRLNDNNDINDAGKKESKAQRSATD